MSSTSQTPDALLALAWLNPALLLTGGADEALRVWAVDEGKAAAKLVKTVRAAHVLGIHAITGAPDGERACRLARAGWCALPRV